jgi:2-polyprenyl-6-methoxyphenol hydroxylase-like FAD-dependent oxidoreductase
MLVGDLALFFLPLGGQALQSGFTDSSDLAWRLTHCPSLGNYELRRLFESWSMQLKQQIEQALAHTV